MAVSPYNAVVVCDETGERHRIDLMAPSFGAALEVITRDHVPDGWRIEHVEATRGRRLDNGQAADATPRAAKAS